MTRIDQTNIAPLHLGPGSYVLAVSGGVDSMVLLDMASALGDVDLTVAHIDHGIRDESHEDEAMVRAAAERYAMKYVSARLNLGRGASETTARNARYNALRDCCVQADATLVTAHHQDDVVETMILNFQRGTGWRGLVSLRDHATLRRPLLGYRKAELVRYAIERGLDWHEDVTNEDLTIARNYVRAILPRLSTESHADLIKIWHEQCEISERISAELTRLGSEQETLSRYMIIMVDETSALELIGAWCKAMMGFRPQPSTLRRLYLFAKTGLAGAECPVEQGVIVRASSRSLIVPSRET